jgi:hypothetical protein
MLAAREVRAITSLIETDGRRVVATADAIDHSRRAQKTATS